MICKYGNEVQSCTSSPMNCQCCYDALEQLDEPVMKEHYCPAEKAIINYHGECNWCGEKQ